MKIKKNITLLFLLLCCFTILINFLKLESLTVIFIYGGLICLYLFFIIKKYWHARREIAYLCIFLIFIIVAFPIWLFSIPH